MQDKTMENDKAAASRHTPTNPPQKSLEERRRDLANLVGQLLADHWLRHREPASEAHDSLV